MNENYSIKHSSELSKQTNLPSFATFNSNTSQYSPGAYLSHDLFAFKRTEQNEIDFTKDEEEDSSLQYFLPSNSSISTPDIINSIYSNNSGYDNLASKRNIEQNNDLWLKVEFLSPSSFFYKDVDKPSNAVKLSYLPKRDNPVLYVEKGRVIELATEINFNPPTNSVMKFDIYSLKGTREEPVYGTTDDNMSGNGGSKANLCFIQATEEKKTSAYYLKSEDGFIAMIIPIRETSLSFSAVFPFLNFKCPTSTKKVVFLRISICSGSTVIVSQKFQLVCCTSPNRDYKRHFEKLNSVTCNKVPAKKMKLTNVEDLTDTTGVNAVPQRTNITDIPQYVIMTENYDIWKILHVVHQQLNAHFNSTKK